VESDFSATYSVKAKNGLLKGNITAHFTSILSRNNLCHYPWFEVVGKDERDNTAVNTIIIMEDGQYDTDSSDSTDSIDRETYKLYNEDNVQDYVYRLVPGYEHELFEDHDIVERDSCSIKSQELVHAPNNQRYAATLKMPEISGVSFSETKRPPRTLEGMSDEIKCVIANWSSPAKQLVEELFYIPEEGVMARRCFYTMRAGTHFAPTLSIFLL
jgi:hypothetical protein